MLIWVFGILSVCHVLCQPLGNTERGLNVNSLSANVEKLFAEQTNIPSYQNDIPTENRIKGAIRGTFIGNALVVGCHCYYNYEQLWKKLRRLNH